MLMPVYAMLLLVAAVSYKGAALSSAYIWLLLGGTLLLTCIIPFSVILLMIRQGQLRDAYIDNKDLRLVPYIYSIAATIAWCLFLWRVMKMPAVVTLMVSGATLALVIVTVINRWWKISAHLSCMGALCGAVAGYSWYTGSFNLWLLPTLLFVALLLMYARIFLKAHTPMQTVCGFLLGLLLTFAPAVAYELW